MATKLQLETTAPFQGLPELVAYDEGLFAAEGLDVEWIDHGENAPVNPDRTITAPQGVDQSSSGSRQIGRRAIVTHGALMVPPWSQVYTPQQLANVPVGVPYYAGTHFLALLMLEGFLPHESIQTCLAPNGGRNRFRALMNHELEATTLTEPYITVAEKAGCRIICEAPY